MAIIQSFLTIRNLQCQKVKWLGRCIRMETKSNIVNSSYQAKVSIGLDTSVEETNGTSAHWHGQIVLQKLSR